MVTLEKKTSNALFRLQRRPNTSIMGLIHFRKKKDFKYMQNGYSPGRTLGVKLDLATELLCLA